MGYEQEALDRIADALQGIYEIKREYADSQKKRPETITEKQLAYLNRLLEERNVTFRGFAEMLSRGEASRLISKLKEAGK